MASRAIKLRTTAPGTGLRSLSGVPRGILKDTGRREGCRDGRGWGEETGRKDGSKVKGEMLWAKEGAVEGLEKVKERGKRLGMTGGKVN